MPNIDSTIIQPLRWYDSIIKQNFRRAWVKNGLRKFNVIINPINSIIPFQIRRYHSLLPITKLDLYDAETDVFYEDILTKLTAPVNNHLKVYQMGVVDNIVFNQVAAFTSDLDGGYYYLHCSDGSKNFYSEVFYADCNFKPQSIDNAIEIDGHHIIGDHFITVNYNTGELLELSNLPY